MKPDGRTPAGASIYITRSRNHSIISIDRWPIADATAEQCAAVYDLFLTEFIEHLASPKWKTYSFLAQPSIWTGTTTRAREQALLEQLIAIEGRGVNA